MNNARQLPCKLIFVPKMKTGYKVCDAMTRKPVIVSPDATIEECAKVMEKENVGSLLVKNGGALGGIITDQDIVRKIIAKGDNPKTTKVSQYMTKKLVTISPEKDIFEAISIMAELSLKQLPVLDGSKMLGLLTQKDVLKIEPELFDLLVDKLVIKEEESKPIRNEGACEECGNYCKRLLVRNGSMICNECAK